MSDASSDNEKAGKNHDELSDYIDENFDLEETDELWGLRNKLNNC